MVEILKKKILDNSYLLRIISDVVLDRISKVILGE